MFKAKYLLFFLILLFSACQKGEQEASVNVPPDKLEIKNLIHPDKFVREQAAEKLGEKRDKKAVPELLASLEDTEARVRAAAARALGKIGDKSAIDRLVEIGRSDLDREVRRSIALALSDLDEGGEEVNSLLLFYLKDENPDVRIEAANTFGTLGEKAKPAVERLIRSLDDTNEEVRQASENALVKIGDAGIEELSIALKEGRFYIRDSVAQILGKIGSEKALLTLRASKDDDI